MQVVCPIGGSGGLTQPAACHRCRSGPGMLTLQWPCGPPPAPPAPLRSAGGVREDQENSDLGSSVLPAAAERGRAGGSGGRSAPVSEASPLGSPSPGTDG